MEKAHDLLQEERTVDIWIEDDVKFSDMLLSESVLKGLAASGFKIPSPIQRKAIPIGRCGFDLIVRAKSGTGKTCVFTVVALEMVIPHLRKLQVVILAPTREICVQIENVVSSISCHMKTVKVESFIGGLPLENDKKKIAKCQIAVGTPGRMKHLISSGVMDLDAVRLFVLDEADRLAEDNFREDICYIFAKLPSNKQIIAASATFPEDLEKFLTRHMKNPIKVSPGQDTILLGVRQFVSIIPDHPTVLVQMKNKTSELIKILSGIPFKQCLVFSNYQSRAESICDELNKKNWPAIYINGSQTQMERLKAFNSLKEFSCRVLISTDLTSRGIDAANVNLIVNLDLPYDGATYLHRIGRAGRYGTYGIAITIIQNQEAEQFRKLLHEIGGENFGISIFPKELPSNIREAKEDSFEKISSLSGGYKFMKNINSESIKKASKIKEKKKTEENISVIYESHLRAPKKLSLQSLESLSDELADFKINGELTVEYEKKENCDYIEDISRKFESSLVYLIDEGLKSFERDLRFVTSEANDENKNSLKLEKEEEVQEEVEEEEDEEEEEAEEEEEEEDEEKEDEEDVSETNGSVYNINNDFDDNEDESDEYDFKSISFTNFERSDFIEETESEETCNKTECEISNTDNFSLNNKLQAWYSMWFSQIRLIRHYVQYYNYWRDVINSD